MAATRRHRSSASPLACFYAALVVYASLYPFEGWRWPPGQPLQALLALPWPAPWLPVDLWSNAMGYLPLGLLLMVAAQRSGWRLRWALVLALLLPAGLSHTLEVLQQFLPGRHASLKDWVMNTLGAAAGVLLAQAWVASGGIERWHRLRQRWFSGDSAFALALLLLWPLALLFPTPVPLGLGQVLGELRNALLAVLDGVPWAESARTLLSAGNSIAHAGAGKTGISPLLHFCITTLGLLAPCLLACSVIPPGWRRAVVVVGALLLALLAMTLSTLLNFGPEHAFAWLTPTTLQALSLGTLLGLALLPWPPRAVLALAVVAVTSLIATVAQAPSDPYFAQSLQAWEQGRFMRFHGLTQWLGWLWPFAALAWLLARVVAGDPSQGLRSRR